MSKCDFNKVEVFNKVKLRYECPQVNLQHIFRTPFPKKKFNVGKGNTRWVLFT